MRKINKKASEALIAMRDWRQDNTRVTVHNGIATMMLHGNAIAKYDGQTLQVSFAGWATRTTCARLNALHGVEARIKKGDGYINGERTWVHGWVLIESVHASTLS